MIYGSTKEATNWEPDDWVTKTIKVALFFIPRANKDIEPLYPQINTWLVEVDSEGKANREIAIDKNENVLFCTPNDRNCGYWTDCPKVFSEDELAFIDKDNFEQLWNEHKSHT
ncbi:MAG: hypothetical protein GY931_17615 [Maribacter sp.]|nr:hypothetical protein [Maribacter sp.]